MGQECLKMFNKKISLISLVIITILSTILLAQEEETSLNFDRTGLTSQQIESLESFRKIPGAPAYIMEFSADYYFDDYLKVGGSPYYFLYGRLPGAEFEGEITCSSFSASTPEGDALHCYNQDYYADQVRHSLVLFTNPEGGYRSISQIRSDFTLSWDFYDNPENNLFRNSVLGAAYCPFDGMNEFGLCVSPMYVDSDLVIDPEKISISILSESRLILDYARDVDEAIELLDQYNNLASNQQHILISDVHGNSAIIEYFRGQMVVTRNVHNYQICTNFPIDGYGTAYQRNKVNDRRYMAAEQALEGYEGIVSEEQAFDILQIVAQRDQVNTYWSSVANKVRGTFDIYYHLNYQDKYQFDIPMAVDISLKSLHVNKKRLKRGKKVKFKVEAVNDSPRYSREGKIRIYLSKKQKVTGKSILVGSTTLKALKANESTAMKIKAVIPKDIDAKDYYVVARVEGLPNRDTDSSNDLISSTAKFTVK
jgi:hypothetical protein